MLEEFIRFKTLFASPENRTIESLKKIYDDSEEMKKIIAELISPFLNEEVIGDKNILLKPNWVLHDRKDDDNICLRTNDAIIISILSFILQYKPRAVVIGDAPIQGCNWDAMISNRLSVNVNAMANEFNIPITIKDFRRTTFSPELNNPSIDRSPLSEYLIFDLGKNSHLESITSGKNEFRVTSYNPDRLIESHSQGIHKYCITKELFSADVIISLPKVKTHQKTGITCALKNLVGINGDKDYLPHHRIGGTGFGGDCYPGKNVLRLMSEYLLDEANRRQGKWSYKIFSLTSAIVWKLTKPSKLHHLSAAWHGNDTTWRMVLDLNKIALYGRSDGTISSDKQRVLFSFCDGIIAGQGDGPLKPEPHALGVISFTNNSHLNDYCMAILMGFEPENIPLLNSFSRLYNDDNYEIILDSYKVGVRQLKNISLKTLPAPGWVDHLIKC
jgi:uncharacterized protein (DUF362 family)